MLSDDTLCSAVKLIRSIANGLGIDGSEENNGHYATTTAENACKIWLLKNDRQTVQKTAELVLPPTAP